MITAVKEGAVTADNFDTVLTKYYSKFGFVPVAKVTWNDEFAPDGWSKETFKDFNNGEPDVVALVYDGGNRQTITERVGTFDDVKTKLEEAPYVTEWDDAKALQVEAGQEITEQDVAILDKNKSKKEIIKSRKQTFSKASSVEMFENLEILQPKREANGRTKVIELGRAFDKRAKDNGYYIPIPKNGVYTDSQLNKIAEAMTDDAQLQLLQDDSGIGWYDLKTRSAMELMSRIHPELSDSNSKPHLEFTLMVALISQNNSVGINFRQANEAYTYYKNNNKLPNKPYAGKSGNIIKQNIALAF